MNNQNDASGLKHGAFHPDLMRQLRKTTGLRLHGVLSHELSANVSARVHPTKPLLLTAYYGAESRLDLWNLDSGKHLQEMQIRGEGGSEATGVMLLGPNGLLSSGAALPIRDLDLSPIGNFAAVACGNQIRLVTLNLEEEKIESLIELDADQSSVHGVAFSYQGDMLAGASNDGTIAVWSVSGRQILSRFKLEGARLRCISFSNDDLLLACGDTDGNVAVWDVVTGHQMAYFQAHEGEVRSVRFGPHGYLLATAGADGAIRLWDMAQASPFGKIMRHGDSIYDIVFHKQGGLLYSCSFDQRVGVWHLDTQELIDAYENDDAVLSIGRYQEDSHLVLATSSALKVLRFDHNPHNYSPPAQFTQGSSTHGLRGLPDDSLDSGISLVASMDGDVSLIGDLDNDYLEARRISELSQGNNNSIWGMPAVSASPPPQNSPPAQSPLGAPMPSANALHATPQERFPAPQPAPMAPTIMPPTAQVPGGAPLKTPLSKSSAPLKTPLSKPSAPLKTPLSKPNQAAVQSPLGPPPGFPPPPGLARPGAAPSAAQISSVRSNALEQRKKSDLAEKKESIRYQLAIAASILFSILAGAGAWVTAPTVEEVPEYMDAAEPILKEHNQKLAEEESDSEAEIERLQAKIQRVRQGAGTRNVQPIINEINKAIKTERERNTQAMSLFEEQLRQQTRDIREEHEPNTILRVAAVSAVTLAASLLSFWLLFFLLFGLKELRKEEEELNTPS